jgi:hypothetical protein
MQQVIVVMLGLLLQLRFFRTAAPEQPQASVWRESVRRLVHRRGIPRLQAEHFWAGGAALSCLLARNACRPNEHVMAAKNGHPKALWAGARAHLERTTGYDYDIFFHGCDLTRDFRNSVFINANIIVERANIGKRDARVLGGGFLLTPWSFFWRDGSARGRCKAVRLYRAQIAALNLLRRVMDELIRHAN